MRRAECFGTFLISLWLILWLTPAVLADVSPGDTIDATNWEKAEGLLPESVLNWVKKGDFVLNIRDLEYNPAEFFPPHALESFKTNLGRYEVDDKDQIIEVKTEKRPSFISGLPFPEIDENDPKGGQKLLYNKFYGHYSQGNFFFTMQVVWVGRSGYEREVEIDTLQAPYDGYPAAMDISNPDKLERQLIIAVRSPFDVAGTTVMLWRYLGDRQDTNFSYVPAIRRLRRVSAANRSDPFVGSDGATDDFMGYDGKIPVFKWKMLKKQVALLPFLSTAPQALVKTKKGEYSTTKNVTPVTYGFNKEGWQGASWCPVSFVWSKRPVYLIEMEPEDRYYNYGTQYLWVDAETFWAIWKVIYDRSGRYWKTMFVSQAGFETADNKMRAMLCSSMQCIDDRTDHATYVEIFSQRNESRIFADVDYDDFSLAGIAKYCK